MNLHDLPRDHDPGNWPEWCRNLAALEAFKQRRLYPKVRVRGSLDLSAVEILSWA